MSQFLEKVGVLIAVPDGADGFRFGGVPVPVRLLRQLRQAGAQGPAWFVFRTKEAAERWQARAEREHARAVPVSEMTLSRGEWIVLPGDLVLNTHHLSDTLQPTSDSFQILAWAQAACSGRSIPVTLPPEAILGRASDPQSASALDDAFIKRPCRDEDPNFTRLWKRWLTRPVSRKLAQHNISPNSVTLAATGTGLAAAALLSWGTYLSMLLGATLLVLSRWMDDCDGEVARFSVRETRQGAMLDLGCDLLVCTAAFVGLALGLHRLFPGRDFTGPLVLLLAGAAISTILLLRYVIGTPLPQQWHRMRWFERSASGDFAYILLAFTLAGKPDWFLWAAAIGAQPFWIALALLILAWRGALIEGTLYLLGAALLVVLILQIGLEELVAHVSAIGWGFLLILAQEVLAVTAATIGWLYALPPANRTLPFSRMWSFRVIAESINHLTPTATIGGEIIRARLASPYMGKQASTASVTLAKFAETAGEVAFLTVGLIIVLPFLGPLGGYRWPIMGVVSACALGVLLLRRLLDRGLFRLAAQKLSSLPLAQRWLTRHAGDIAAIDSLIRDCVRSRPTDLVLSILWHTGSYASRLIETGIILFFFGISPTPSLVLGIEVLSVLIDTILFFVPSRLGTQEGGRMLIFVALGLPADQGLALGLIRRGRQLVWDCVGLGLYWVVRDPVEKGFPRMLHEIGGK